MEQSFLSDTLDRRGVMLVLSSPSGAGKSTLTRLLRDDAEMNLSLSVSVTTRERRVSEVDGVHYHFISVDEFMRKREDNQLLEWAEVHGNYYATLRETAEKALSQGQDILFDIDWQGAEQLQQKMPDDVVSIFILPPSLKELENRLHRRAEDSAETIQLRLKNARVEIEKWQNYDFVVINEDIQQAFKEIKSIVRAERLRRARRPGLQKFIANMLDSKAE